MLSPEQVWNIAGAICTRTLNKDESARVSEVGGRERQGERERRREGGGGREYLVIIIPLH